MGLAAGIAAIKVPLMFRDPRGTRSVPGALLWFGMVALILLFINGIYGFRVSWLVLIGLIVLIGGLTYGTAYFAAADRRSI